MTFLSCKMKSLLDEVITCKYYWNPAAKTFAVANFQSPESGRDTSGWRHLPLVTSLRVCFQIEWFFGMLLINSSVQSSKRWIIKSPKHFKYEFWYIWLMKWFWFWCNLWDNQVGMHCGADKHLALIQTLTSGCCTLLSLTLLRGELTAHPSWPWWVNHRDKGLVSNAWSEHGEMNQCGRWNPRRTQFVFYGPLWDGPRRVNHCSVVYHASATVPGCNGFTLECNFQLTVHLREINDPSQAHGKRVWIFGCWGLRCCTLCPCSCQEEVRNGSRRSRGVFRRKEVAWFSTTTQKSGPVGLTEDSRNQ